jgi:hypothetical protein
MGNAAAAFKEDSICWVLSHGSEEEGFPCLGGNKRLEKQL